MEGWDAECNDDGKKGQMVHCQRIWVDGYVSLALGLCRGVRGSRVLVCRHEKEVEYVIICGTQ